MGIRRLAVVTVIGIIAAVIATIGIFKVVDSQQYPYVDITIKGLKENYTINEPLEFSVAIEGYGSGCGYTKIIITKENDLSYKSPTWFNTSSCAHTQLQTFNTDTLSVNTAINQTGNYILKVSFTDSLTSQHAIKQLKFSVN